MRATAVGIQRGLALTGLVLVGSAAPASAGTVSIVGGEPRFVAAGGEKNQVKAGKSGGVFTVSDVVPLTAGTGCTPLSAKSAQCPSPSTRITIQLGNRSDLMLMTGGTAVTGMGGTGDDALGGRGQADTLSGGRGADDLQGGNGNDTATYAGYGASEGVTVTLDDVANDGNPTADGGRKDNVHSDVENLVGGSGDDVLNGSPAGNSLAGRAGADTLNGRDADDLLTGGPGPDLLAGGPGIDTSSYADRTTGVTVTLDHIANDGNSDDGSADSAQTENVVTGSGDDTVTGDGGINVIDTGSGADSAGGGAGPDTINGGPGDDTLGQGVVTADEDGNDTINGGPGDDIVRGGDNHNVVNGGDGNDTLDGAFGGIMGASDDMHGGTGDDTLIPGDNPDDVQGDGGFDTVDYRNHNYTEAVAAGPTGVVVTLDGVRNDGNNYDCSYLGSGECNGSALDNVGTTIEQVIGTNSADGDTLVGDDLGNTLVGAAGPDILRGHGGDDDLQANDGEADQEINCGDGSSDAADVDFVDPATDGCENVTVGP
jgi:Ca2+-binding RTX toxin-like protein